MGKLPAIQFYPGDWLRDNIAGCSLAAQGLWLRMMFIGHDSERYGYLQQNGQPIPSESIARRCGCTPEQYSALLTELELAGIPGRTPEGIIFSRRMVKDAVVRLQTADRVKKHRSNAPVTQMKRPCTEDEYESEVIPKGITVITAKTVPFNAQECAQIIAGELGVSWKDTKLAIAEQLNLEIRRSSTANFEGLTELMIRAGKRYQEALRSNKLEKPWGLARFYGEGHWSDESSWPWKGKGNAGERKQRGDEAIERAVARIREADDVEDPRRV